MNPPFREFNCPNKTRFSGIACRNFGSPCQWQGTAETEEQLVPILRAHVKEVHPDLDKPEIMAQFIAGIKTV